MNKSTWNKLPVKRRVDIAEDAGLPQELGHRKWDDLDSFSQDKIAWVLRFRSRRSPNPRSRSINRNPVRRGRSNMMAGQSRYPLTTTPAERLADEKHRRRINGSIYHEVAVYPDKGTAQIKANFTRRELGKPARIFHTSHGWSVYVAHKGK